MRIFKPLLKLKSGLEIVAVADLPSGVNYAEYSKLLEAASKDPFLGPLVLEKDLKSGYMIIVDGVPVGINIPREQKSGWWRVGPIYITPVARGRGYATEYLIRNFKDKPAEAYIEPANTSSQRAFGAAGFIKDNKEVKWQGDVFQRWYKP